MKNILAKHGIWAALFLGSFHFVNGQSLTTATIIEHAGSANPSTEGFTGYDLSTGGGSTGAIASPEGAWSITDGTGGRTRYEYAPSPAEIAEMMANGFVLEGRVRSPGAASPVDNHAVIDLCIGGLRCLLQFGSDAAGNAKVNLSGAGGGTVTLASGGFHDFMLVYQNGAGVFYIDGAPTSFTNYTGSATSLDIIRFGGITTTQAGTADYAVVRISSLSPGWRSVAVGGGGYCLGIVADPNVQNLFYLKTDIGGAYRWNAAENKWTAITDKLPPASQFIPHYFGIESVAVDPSTANRVYISTGKIYSVAGAVWRSDNAGETWKKLNLPASVESHSNTTGKQAGERLAVDPNNPEILYYSTRRDGLWKITNATTAGTGAWTQVASFPTVGQADWGLTFVVFDKNGGTVTVNGQVVSKILYVGVYNAGNGGTVYRSSDGGVNWSTIGGGLTTPTRAQMAADGTLYVTYRNYSGVAGGIGKVARTGTAFTMINPVASVPADMGYGALAVDPANSGTVYVCQAKSAYKLLTYKTTNGGANWSVVTNGDLASGTYTQGLKNISTRGSVQWFGNVSAMAINPFNTNELWISDWLGALRTSNINAAVPVWDYPSKGHEEIVPLCLRSAPSGAPLLSGSADINGYRHTDVAASPAAQFTDVGAVSDGSTTSLDFCEADPNVWVRAFNDFGSNGNGWKSSDNGQTWSPFGAKPFSNARGGRIAVSPTSTQNYVWAPEGTASSIYYTTNGGTAWTAGAGAPTGLGVTQFEQDAQGLCSDRVTSGRFYAFKSLTGSGQIYRSDNSGASWSLVSTITYPTSTLKATTYKIVAAPGIAGEVWLSIGKIGLHRSTDAGATFSKLTNIGNGNGMVAFGKAKPGNSNPAVYLMRPSGNAYDIFRSDDLGATWEEIDDPAAPINNYPRVIEGDRQTYGRVYIGTDGRGIYVGDSGMGAATPDIIMDSSDPSGITVTGAWSGSSSAPDFFGADYLHDGNTGKGTKSVQYTPSITEAGNYEVFAWWTENANRASNVPIDITGATGTSTITVNQRVDGGGWVSLGIFSFATGTGNSVLIRTTGANGYVIADAVRFLKQ